MDQQEEVLLSGRLLNVWIEIEKFLEVSGAIEAVIETGRSSYAIRSLISF